MRKDGNPLCSAFFSSCLDRVWHIFSKIFCHKKRRWNPLIRGKLSYYRRILFM
jgi:hypothetical protein